MNATKFVGEVDDFSNHKLKRKDDLNILFAISINDKKENLFESLSFSAKYVLGLQRVLKKGGSNPEVSSLDKIKEDYTNSLLKSIEQIKELINFSPEETKTRFNKIYFELSRQSLQNLNELLEDLEWTKIYLNQRKRKSQS